MVLAVKEIFAQQAHVAFIGDILKQYMDLESQPHLLQALEASNAPEHYQYAVLKKFVALIESSPGSAGQVHDDVIAAYGELMLPKFSTPSAAAALGSAAGVAGQQTAGLGLASSSGSASGHSRGDPVYYRCGENSTIVIEETKNVLSEAGSTGHRTWDAALGLAEYLLSHPHFVRDRPVLDLGAGTGLDSMVAALCGASNVVVTDGDAAVCESLKLTLAANRIVGSCRQLLWRDPMDEADRKELNSFAAPHQLIIAADVLYDDVNFLPFLNVVKQLLQQPSSQALVCTAVRNLDRYNDFKKLALDRGLRIEVAGEYDPNQQTSEWFWFPPGAKLELIWITGSESAASRS